MVLVSPRVLVLVVAFLFLEAVLVRSSGAGCDSGGHWIVPDHLGGWFLLP